MPSCRHAVAVARRLSAPALPCGAHHVRMHACMHDGMPATHTAPSPPSPPACAGVRAGPFVAVHGARCSGLVLRCVRRAALVCVQLYLLHGAGQQAVRRQHACMHYTHTCMHPSHLNGLHCAALHVRLHASCPKPSSCITLHHAVHTHCVWMCACMHTRERNPACACVRVPPCCLPARRGRGWLGLSCARWSRWRAARS